MVDGARPVRQQAGGVGAVGSAEPVDCDTLPRMPSTQNRAPLGESLAFHSHRPASSLTARQYTSTLTSSTTFPDGKDSAIVNATGGAVGITLPAGSDSIIGLPFHAERANADATSNAVALVCAGTDTFVDGGTSISSTATADAGLHLAAVWDGANWRPYFPTAANGGPGAFSTLTAATSLTVGDGTGSPAANLDKSGAGTGNLNLKAVGVLRGPFIVSKDAPTQKQDEAVRLQP